MHHLKTYLKNQWLMVALFVVFSVGITVWWLVFGGLDTLQSALTSISNEVNASDNKLLWLSVYAVVCLLSQLLIVPSGSLILMAAGFVFSPLLAAGIFSIAQVLSSWPVYSIGKVISDKFPDRFDQITRNFKLPTDWHKIVHKEGFYATVVLRLTPVIPSAAACLLAAGLNIGLKSFIPATLAVCWIRPLFFASIGGSLQSLTGLSTAVDGAALKPLLLVFIAAIILLMVKVYMHYKSRNA